MPFTFGEDSFNKGESTGVSCMIVKGDLPLTIKWTLNSRPIVSNANGITIVKLSAKTSVLNIAAVDQEHRGLVRCIAENPAGRTDFASELHINGLISVCSQHLQFSFRSPTFSIYLFNFLHLVIPPMNSCSANYAILFRR